MLAPRLGVATTLALVITGQALGSLVVDHYGLVGMAVRSELRPSVAAVGDEVEATLTGDIKQGKVKLVPKGATVKGRIVEAMRADRYIFPVIPFLVICASILAVNAFHSLMRRGQATRVTSLIYLTPVFAVALELPMFGVVPSAISLTGIAVTCLGVAMVSWRGRTAA